MNVYNKIKLGVGTVDPSSILDITSIDKGVLFPRMTTIQRDAIATPTTSLFIFNTSVGRYQMYDGGAWVDMSTGADHGNWTFNGNEFKPTNKTTVSGAAPARMVIDTEQFIVGKKYIIGVNGGPLDVTNIGAPNNNSQTSFYATGTTPTNYSNGNSSIYEYNTITEGTEVLFSDTTGFIGYQWFTYKSGKFESSAYGTLYNLDTWDALIAYLTPANFPNLDATFAKVGDANTFYMNSKPYAYATSYITLPLSSTLPPPDTYINGGSVFSEHFYRIEDYEIGDDFTNLGAVSNTTGVGFISSGTTPNTWSNGTVLKHFRFTDLTFLGLIGSPLVIGQTYVLLDNIGADDFTNIGAVSNTPGEIFVATGTTPTLWNTTQLLILFQPDLLTIGETYEILTLMGDDDFIGAGAVTNTPGEIFTATATVPTRWVNRSLIRVYFTTLVIGAEYEIVTFAPGDNFLDVGAAANASGVKFIATGTTPGTWVNGSILNKTEPYLVEGESVNAATVQHTLAATQASVIGSIQNRPEGDFNSIAVANWATVGGRLDVLSGKLLIGASETGGYIESGDHAVQILASNATQGLLTLIGGSGLVQVWNDTAPSQAFAWGIAEPGNAPDGNFYISRWSPGWSSALAITNANGYVGLGISTPTVALHIGSASGNANIAIVGDGGTRNISVEDSPSGPGSNLNITAGGGTGIAAEGGDLILSGGTSQTSVGGHAFLEPGVGTSAGRIYIGTTAGTNVNIGTTNNGDAMLYIGDSYGNANIMLVGGGTDRTISVESNNTASNLKVIAGSSNAGDGANLYLIGGSSSAGDGGDVLIDAGLSLAGIAGNIFISTADPDGGYVGIGTTVVSSKLTVDNPLDGSTQFRLVTSYTPTSSGDTNGNPGDVAWDDNYFYMKTNSGWGRTLWDYGF